MNERFAADPECFRNSAELRNVLEKFGVFTGRYLVIYPEDWNRRLSEHMANASPVEASQISRLVHRAQEQCGLIKMPSLMWMDNLSWVDNASKQVSHTPPRLDGLVVKNDAPKVPLRAKALNDFEVPPTAEERISSTPAEYVRVTKMQLLIAHELLLIDPYLNPCNKLHAPVLEALLKVVASPGSKCKLVKIYARERDVLSEGTTEKLIQSALNALVAGVKREKTFKLTYHLIDDSNSTERMHDRYLLSVKGGIQLSQGFQVQRRNGKVTASPIGPSLHREIWGIYMDRKTDMRICRAISVSS
jgi:hypothetical protein